MGKMKRVEGRVDGRKGRRDFALMEDEGRNKGKKERRFERREMKNWSAKIDGSTNEASNFPLQNA